MIALDADSMLAALALIALVPAAVFATTTTLRHDDAAGRLATAGFVAGASACLLAAVWGIGQVLPTRGNIVIATGVMFCIASLWAGTARLGGEVPHAGRVVLGATGASAVISLLPEVGVPGTAARSLGELAVAAFSVYAVRDLMSGPMRGNINQRIVTAVYGVTAVGGLVRAVLQLSPAHQERLEVITVGGLAVRLVIMAICLSALRVERHGNWWALDDEVTHSSRALPTSDRFSETATDRLERGALRRVEMVLLTIEILDLQELNLAFGRAAGDAAMDRVADVLRSSLPPSALLGHVGGNRFAALTEAAGRLPAERVVREVTSGLLETDLPPNLPVRFSSRVGWSVTTEQGHDLDALLTGAAASVRSA